MENSSTSAFPSNRLEGKVALITGGASGIGECTARLFARHGAKVIIADIQDDLGHALCKDIGTAKVSYIHCDVTSEPDVQNAVDSAMEKHGKLDIMFNNAGIAGNTDPKVTSTDIEEFKRVLEVNVCGCFLGAKHAARVMIPARKGSILFTSSVATMTSGIVTHAYTASKHAILGIMKNLTVELGQYGIRVNCISPFAVPTPLLSNAYVIDKEKLTELACESAILKDVALDVNDVAEAALYLSSDEAKYVSGHNLVIDGGYSLTNPTLALNLRKLMSVVPTMSSMTMQ